MIVRVRVINNARERKKEAATGGKSNCKRAQKMELWSVAENVEEELQKRAHRLSTEEGTSSLRLRRVCVEYDTGGRVCHTSISVVSSLEFFILSYCCLNLT